MRENQDMGAGEFIDRSSIDSAYQDFLEDIGAGEDFDDSNSYEITKEVWEKNMAAEGWERYGLFRNFVGYRGPILFRRNPVCELYVIKKSLTERLKDFFF